MDESKAALRLITCLAGAIAAQSSIDTEFFARSIEAGAQALPPTEREDINMVLTAVRKIGQKKSEL